MNCMCPYPIQSLRIQTNSNFHRTSLTGAQLHSLIQKQIGRWPTLAAASAVYPKYQKGRAPKKDILIQALLDPALGFSTTKPLKLSPAAAAELSKSKTLGSRTVSTHKERAVEEAIDAGTVKSSPVADELKAHGIGIAIPPVSSR